MQHSIVLAIVTPSDRLSAVNCDKTNETCAQILIPYERSVHLVFQQKMVGGG